MEIINGFLGRFRRKHLELQKEPPISEETIQSLHQDVWSLVSNELKLAPEKKEGPHLWYGSPAQVITQISHEVSSQTGVTIPPRMTKRQINLTIKHNLIGITPSYSTSSSLILPGIILTENWPRIITHPGRILLHENINSVFLRTSPLYQIIASEQEFRQSRFGPNADVIRDLLLFFFESVATVTTGILQKRLGIAGEYTEAAKQRSVSLDFKSSKGIPQKSHGKEQGNTNQELLLLDEILYAERYNPATQAQELFGTWCDRISELDPDSRSSIQETKDRILIASIEYKTLHPVIQAKETGGKWITIANK